MTTSNAEDAKIAEFQRLDIHDDGFAIVEESPLAFDNLEALRSELGGASSSKQRRGGIRSILRDVPSVRELAYHSAARDVAAAVLGEGCFPVRAICFDKTQDANWNVSWHQDLTIAVRERRPAPGFGAWTLKDDVVHVQPPVEILERMISVRVHLDDCGAENGPLRVIPGSHQSGRLDRDRIEEWRRRVAEAVCHVPAGGLLLMRPLILHSSSKATSPSHRRVVHIEYAVDHLPFNLQWFEQS